MAPCFGACGEAEGREAYSKQEEKTDRGQGQDSAAINLQWPTVRHCFLEVPQPPKLASPAGAKHTSKEPVGIFHIQITT